MIFIRRKRKEDIWKNGDKSDIIIYVANTTKQHTTLFI